jgi:hypothetical protein
MRPCIFLILVLALPACAEAHAQDNKTAAYPSMAPIEQYLMTDRNAEIALARTAAPPSISADAQVLVLGNGGYEPAVEGKNGFVCFVERSWTAGFEDAEFWNPKTRSPNCFNAAAARTELTQILKRTEWVLAGANRDELMRRTRAAFADKTFTMPEAGSFSFMLSKEGYLSDQAGGPWLPHGMFFVPHGQAAMWGAGLDGSPVIGQEGSDIESTVLFIPVRRWSDGSPAPVAAPQHTHT